MRILTTIILLTLAVLPNSAFAIGCPTWFPSCPWGSGSGGSGTASGNEFDLYYSDIIDGDFKDSLADPENEFSGFTVTDNVQMPIATIHLNSKNPCTGSTCNSPAEGKIMPGLRGVPLEAMLPGTLDTQTDYMWSTDSVNMSQNNLNSPQVVWDVSMFLAESAVAQGQQNAFMKSAALNTNGLLETLGVAAVSEKFEGSQPAVQSYFWCIQKKLEEGMGLPKARMVCGRDKGEKSSGAEGAVGSVPGFSFDTNPAFNFKGGTIFNSKKILLTDLIFNEESLTSDDGVQLIKVRDSFRSLYGDIEFKLLDTAGHFGQNYTYKKATDSPADAYNKIIIYKFNTLRDIVLKYCKYANGQLDNTSTPQPDDYQSIYEKAGSGGVDNINAAQLKEVSTPGFMMTPAVVGSFRLSYDAFFRGHRHADSENHIWCDPLENSGSFAVVFQPGGESFKTLFQTIPGTGGRQFFQILYHLSRLLALGEWLTKASIAEQAVDFLSTGVNEGSYLEKMAKDLIYRAVGSRYVRDELERVNMQIREYIMQAFARLDTAANISAQEGSSIPRDGK